MGGVGEDSDFKSRLVIEICSFSSRSSTCVHRRFHNPIKAPFIDWYRLLRVEEDAEIDIIRKQYRKLALQLHPDKNGHPKAEVAFKLVSEAYACLSDKTRRRAFDSGRWKSYCTQCNNQSSQSNFRGSSEAGKLKGSDPRVWARSNKSLQGLREIRDRFKEEARVIENCLRAHAASKMDSPLFEPSDYVFQGYPHHRTRVYNNPEDFWYLRSGNSRKYDHRSGTCDSPIFEIRSERSLRSKSACLGS